MKALRWRTFGASSTLDGDAASDVFVHDVVGEWSLLLLASSQEEPHHGAPNSAANDCPPRPQTRQHRRRARTIRVSYVRACSDHLVTALKRATTFTEGRKAIVDGMALARDTLRRRTADGDARSRPREGLLAAIASPAGFVTFDVGGGTIVSAEGDGIMWARRSDRDASLPTELALADEIEPLVTAIEVPRARLALVSAGLVPKVMDREHVSRPLITFFDPLFRFAGTTTDAEGVSELASALASKKIRQRSEGDLTVAIAARTDLAPAAYVDVVTDLRRRMVEQVLREPVRFNPPSPRPIIGNID